MQQYVSTVHADQQVNVLLGYFTVNVLIYVILLHYEGKVTS